MALQSGTIADRYILEEVLGEGGMAIVYRARHRELDSLHAIKQLKVEDLTIRDRLVQEGRLQSGLRHPNVVSVTDLITIEGSPALVMEYVDGPNLDELLSGHRPSMEQCDLIAQGILKGVAAAHAHGMVHRDLKPANIMIAQAGSEIIPKIADFGLAKLLEGIHQNTKLTQDGVIMGTPSYMAPEQLDDSRNVDSRADVFSLGAILYELVCGRRCFEGESVMKVWIAIAKGDFVAPRRLFPSLPERMERAIEGALVPDRDQRISGVNELLKVWSNEEESPNLSAVLSAIDEATGRSTARVPPSFGARAGSDPALEYTYDSFDTPGPTREAHRSQEVENKPIERSSDPALEYTYDSFDLPLETEEGSRESESPPNETETNVIADDEAAQSKRDGQRWLLFITALLIISLALINWPNPTPQSVTEPDGALDGTESVQKTQPTGDPGGSGSKGASLSTARDAILAANLSDADLAIDGNAVATRDSVQGRSLLAITSFLRGRPTDAITHAEEAARLAIDKNGPSAQLAKLVVRSLEPGDSGKTLLKKWDALRRTRPGDPFIALSYLVWSRQLQPPGVLLASIRRTQEEFSEIPAFTVLALRAFQQTGQIDAWRQAARLAELKFPNNVWMNLEASRAELGQVDTSESLRKISRILERKKTLIEARAALADLLARTDDEAARMIQFIESQSDAVPSADRLWFLKTHGSTFAALGKLKGADKQWRFCLDQAKSDHDLPGALECASAALASFAWLAPVSSWTEWMTRMASLLSEPSLGSNVRQFYSLRLKWFKTRAALQQGRVDEVDEALITLSTLAEGAPSALVETPQVAELHFELAERSGDISAMGAALKALNSAQAIQGLPPTCVHRLRSSKFAQVSGDREDEKTELTAILNGDCRPLAQHHFIRADAQLSLAAALLAQNEPTKAKAVLQRFKDEWRQADRDLPIVKRANTLFALASK